MTDLLSDTELEAAIKKILRKYGSELGRECSLNSCTREILRDVLGRTNVSPSCPSCNGTKRMKCPRCKSVKNFKDPCTRCQSSGKIKKAKPGEGGEYCGCGDGFESGEWETCSTCKGKTVIGPMVLVDVECTECNGKGYDTYCIHCRGRDWLHCDQCNQM